MFYKNTLVQEYFGPDMLKEFSRTTKEKGLMYAATQPNNGPKSHLACHGVARAPKGYAKTDRVGRGSGSPRAPPAELLRLFRVFLVN